MTLAEIAALEDTIVAPATPPGRGALGLVRLSGPGAIAILRDCFRPASLRHRLRPNRVCLGGLAAPGDGEAIDQVMAACFQAPRSYTGQDMAEITHHGSPVIAKAIIELCLARGARLAQPGEFTLRAYLHGKLALTQAEAIHDLIGARTAHQARLAALQAAGSVSRLVRPLKEALLGIIVPLETAVEFVEETEPGLSPAALTEQIGQLAGRIEEVEKGFRLGALVRDGASVALAGLPNVGKSSLFNRLAGHERAIVTEIPGTTRDLLRESVDIVGLPVTLVDTAGRRTPADRLDALGQERSEDAMVEADAILVVLDASLPLSPEDEVLLAALPQKPTVTALNKADLPSRLDPGRLAAVRPDLRPWPVSALTGAGLDALREALRAALLPPLPVPAGDENLVTGLRQQECLRRSREELEAAKRCCTQGLSEEYCLYHLHRTLHRLDELTGHTRVEDILERIFSTFCIGK